MVIDRIDMKNTSDSVIVRIMIKGASRDEVSWSSLQSIWNDLLNGFCGHWIALFKAESLVKNDEEF